MLLSAEEDPIILDRDILYWKPAGPDVLIPDDFFSPEGIRYSGDAFLSSLDVTLKRKDLPVLVFEESGVEEDELILNWTPPALFTVNEIKRNHSLKAFSSYPYGSGLLLKGGGDLFFYETGGNYAHRSDAPHWLKGSAGIDNSVHSLGGHFAWRETVDTYFLSLAQWSSEISALSGNTLKGAADFQSVYAPGSSGEMHQWRAAASAGGQVQLSSMVLTSNLESEFTHYQSGREWRLSPELRIGKRYPLIKGNWSVEAGLLADIYSDLSKVRYYPQLSLEYMKYGSWSLFLSSESDSLDPEILHSFLTEEIYSVSELDFYRNTTLKAGFSVNRAKWHINGEGGYLYAVVPELRDSVLQSDLKQLFFADTAVSWKYNDRRVTELSCYADYEDTGRYRYLLENRWSFSAAGDAGKDHTTVLLLRTGNRELVRGYPSVFNTASDRLWGAGIELDFTVPLKASVFMDYLPRNSKTEVYAELRWYY
ncbi:MAG: hypothetical protein PQJ58_09425 [Spirochaetales bacterium]|nr:hypothetical protein [Spirochaetales bacterium]